MVLSSLLFFVSSPTVPAGAGGDAGNKSAQLGSLSPANLGSADPLKREPLSNARVDDAVELLCRAWIKEMRPPPRAAMIDRHRLYSLCVARIGKVRGEAGLTRRNVVGHGVVIGEVAAVLRTERNRRVGE